MAFEIKCDICNAPHPLDERAGGWFTVAIKLAGRSVQVYRWPTGCRLQEPHDKLFHVCSAKHMLDLVLRWENRLFQDCANPEHWRNPESGWVECEVCCDRAMDYDAARKEIFHA